MKIFNDVYRDGLAELVTYYAERPGIMEMIIKFGSIRLVIEGFYQVLVKAKELEPIESLEMGEKQRLWNLAEGLKKKERIEASRAIYLMEKLLQPKDKDDPF